MIYSSSNKTFKKKIILSIYVLFSLIVLSRYYKLQISEYDKYKLLGETVDDAIGESFDKVGKLIGLDYPGGPLVEKLAIKGDPEAFKLPHPLEFKKSLNFSFSGIKTAVNLLVKKNKK